MAVSPALSAPALLVSAGEASGERYAAALVRALRTAHPELSFFGCAGPDMRAAGVEAVVESEALSVVGLVEVLHHIPRIYGEFRKLVKESARRRPLAAILTDSPDFHLRLAAKLRAQGVPVFYLVAPQVWAWRESRVRAIRRDIRELHCIFPFEEPWFRERGVDAVYIGHPLAQRIAPSLTRAEFYQRYSLSPGQYLVTLCPGSRSGEAARHLPVLAETVKILRERHAAQFVLATPGSARHRAQWAFADTFCRALGVTRVEGDTWNAMAHADVTLPASGTVTVEAALLGAPMVTYYRVTPATWWMGRALVRVPFYSMVNLIAGRAIVPEFIQHEMTSANLAREAGDLLRSPHRRAAMLADLLEVRQALQTKADPIVVSASRISTSIFASNIIEEV
jgi:lipid-A-disaccharide synthase